MRVVVASQAGREAGLTESLRSVLQQTHPAVELVLVQRGGDSGEGQARLAAALAGLSSKHPTDVLHLKRDPGWAAAVNAALHGCPGPLGLLLSPGAVLEADAVSAAVGCSLRRPQVAGFALKIRFLEDPDVISSVGVDYGWRGELFPRGRGEVDLGQFDIDESVWGLSSECAVIRSDAWATDRVGQLDSRFAGQLGDADWCLRAALYGERLANASGAACLAAHPGTSQRPSRSAQLKLAIKNFESWHLRGFLLRAGTRRLPAAGERSRSALEALGDIQQLTSLRAERREVQSRRQRHDAEFFCIAADRPPLQSAGPADGHSWAAVKAALGRLYAVTGDQRWLPAYEYLQVVEQFEVVLPRPEMLRHLLDLAGPLPEALVRYAGSISGGGA
ncbi:MAG: glycosyltransferase family 2 protein [Candidatus Dormibacteria bacterium]